MKTVAPRVSIVVPTYNSSRFIATTLASILGQTMTDLEVVVNDDESHDDTVDLVTSIAADDDRVRIIRSPHGGIASTRNTGFAATDERASFVTFFDHDDVWEPGALAALLDALEENPTSPAAHGLAQCIDDNGQRVPHDDHAESTRHRVAVSGDEIVPVPQAAPTSFYAMLIRNYVTTPGTSLVRRDVMASLGGFYAPTVPCDDWDLNIRLARLGPLAFVDDILVNWRRHDGATSNNVGKAWRHAYELTRERSIGDPTNTPEQWAAARTATRSEVQRMAHEAFDRARSGDVTEGAKTLGRSALLGRTLLRHRRRPQAAPTA
jgi:glycosyltransferase involved in cell wall biosynthesis